MSVSDFVGTSKKEMSLPNYVAPSNEMHLKRITHGKVSKSKHLSFAAAIMAKKKWVPGPQYIKVDDWNTHMPKNTGKFGTKERTTIAGDIYHKAKKKETSSPSVHDYNPDVWKKRASIGRTLGNYKQNMENISCVAEAANIFGASPFNKYETIDLNKLKSKPRYTKIYNEGERFVTKDKDMSPSPSSYDIATAVAKTQWQQSKNKAPAQYGFGKSARKSVFGEIAKRSISPGAGAYNASAIEKSYDKIGSSPILAKKRH
jgi:hypothetical protein